MTDISTIDTDEAGVAKILLLTARKSDFVRLVLEGLQSEDSLIDVSAAEQYRKTLSTAVATLDWTFFTSAAEKAAKRLSLATRVEELDRPAIWEALSRIPGLVGV